MKMGLNRSSTTISGMSDFFIFLLLSDVCNSRLAFGTQRSPQMSSSQFQGRELPIPFWDKLCLLILDLPKESDFLALGPSLFLHLGQGNSVSLLSFKLNPSICHSDFEWNKREFWLWLFQLGSSISLKNLHILPLGCQMPDAGSVQADCFRHNSLKVRLSPSHLTKELVFLLP